MYNIMYHNSINVPLRQVYMVVVCGGMMSTFKHCNWWHVSIKCLANISCISKSFLKGSSSSRLNYAYSMTIEQVGYIHTYIIIKQQSPSVVSYWFVQKKQHHLLTSTQGQEEEEKMIICSLCHESLKSSLSLSLSLKGFTLLI